MVSGRGKEMSAGKQRPKLPHASDLPLEDIEKICVCQTPRKFCSSDVRNCYQHSHPSLGPFSFLSDLH